MTDLCVLGGLEVGERFGMVWKCGGSEKGRVGVCFFT